MIVAYATAEDSRQGHEIAGLAAVALVTLRALWGLVGPAKARFDDFVTGPAAIIGYLRGLAAGTAPRFLGHTPAGGAMAVLLLVLVVATGLTGVLMVGGVLPHEAGEELHEILGTSILVVAGAHVLGVVVSSVGHRETLIRSMVTGWKPAPSDPA